MRVNIYDEEITDKVELVQKGGRTGLRFYLELPVTENGEQHTGPFMHGPDDNDSSAVTFWRTDDLRPVLRKALELLDRHYEAGS